VVVDITAAASVETLLSSSPDRTEPSEQDMAIADRILKEAFMDRVWYHSDQSWLQAALGSSDILPVNLTSRIKAT
jgi:hypothetical protein